MRRPATGPGGTRLLALGLGMAALQGCDVLLVSPSLPGVVPGLGQPLRGQVMDSVTGKPVGFATVLTDIGWSGTDNEGRFSLYGAISRRNLSISRAGYGSVTYAADAIQDDQSYFLDPLFPGSGNLPSRWATIVGTVSAAIDGEIVFAGLVPGPIKEGRFALPEIKEALPGNVFSGVLAGGEITGGPIRPSGSEAEREFKFKTFGFMLVDVPFTDKPNGPTWSPSTTLPLASIPTTAKVQYKNTAWASDVKTEITLDFGLLGSIPVARQFGSAQNITIPGLAKYKYILEGTAFNTDRSRISKVVISTNTPGNEQSTAFDLLDPPTPLSPAKNASGVGAHPTFSWNPVTGAQTYMVEVFEPNIPQAKWRGLTNGTSLGYPWFGDGDVNGAALLPGVKYGWAVHAIKAGFETDATKALSAIMPATLWGVESWTQQARSAPDILGIKAGQPFRPFRHKTWESVTRSLEFTR